MTTRITLDKLNSFFFTLFSILAILILAETIIASHCYGAGLNPFEKKDSQKDEDISTFYRDTKEGYYWYKDPVDDEEAPEEEELAEKKPEHFEPNMDNYTEAQIWDLHPDEFQELQKAFLKKAVRNPSEENVVDYLTMQDIARQKAAAYANAVTFVTQKYERFDLADDIPVAAGGIRENIRSKLSNVEDGLDNTEGSFALIFFKDSSGTSRTMDNVVDMFTKNHPGWEARKFDINNNPKIAEAMGISQAPTLVLISDGEENFIPIARGVQSLNEVERRIYRSIRVISSNGDIDDYNTYDYQKGGNMQVRDPRKKQSIEMQKE